MTTIDYVDSTRKCCVCGSNDSVRGVNLDTISFILCKNHMNCLYNALKMDLCMYGIPESESFYSKNYVCPKCNSILDEARDNFCPICGAELLWNEIKRNDEQ